MTTIEDEARAAAIERYSSRVIEDYDGDRYDEDEYGYDATARSAFVEGALWAASRREPSEAATVACPHWSPGRITMRTGCTACAADAEPSHTDEREWEYGCQSRAHVMARRDHGAVVLLDKEWADIHGFDCPWPAIVRRRKAGPWEVVPDGDNR